MRVLDCYPWLPDRFSDVREESGGVYCTAECPLKCHRHARMRFWVGEAGNLLLTCYAGCNKLEALRAVGAGWKDCWPGEKLPDRPKQEVVAKYPYRDEKGVLLYETLRLEPGTRGRDKDFRQRRPARAGEVTQGRWVWNLDGVRRVLYRLPELLRADPMETVFVVAGEKDTDSLAGIGLVATTNVCGERSPWLAEYSRALTGRFVCVIPDADSAGARHADEIVGSLLRHHVSSVRVAGLPDKDATAFLNGLRRSGVSDPGDLREEFWSAVAGCPAWVRE